MKAAPNGNTHPAPGAPAHVATIADAVDAWAVMSHEAGTYTPQQHAAIAAAVLMGTIPILGTLEDGRITWYSAPPTRQAE